MSCRDCPHIALEPWPQGKTAVRCVCAENAPYTGRVLNVTRDSNPYPDSIPTPVWCRRRETKKPE